MSGVPRISGRICVKALAKVGFFLKRQEGSHMILRRDVPVAQVVVPAHKELDKGTLRTIICQAGLRVDSVYKLALILTGNQRPALAMWLKLPRLLNESFNFTSRLAISRDRT